MTVYGKCISVSDPQDGVRAVYAFPNGVHIGEIFSDVDGYHKFWPALSGGYWEPHMLRAIADLVDGMNVRWHNHIGYALKDTMFARFMAWLSLRTDHPDKVLHALAGLLVFALVYVLTGNAYLGLFAAIAAGVLKELFDGIVSKGGGVDLLDAFATIALPLVATLFSIWLGVDHMTPLLPFLR